MEAIEQTPAQTASAKVRVMANELASRDEAVAIRAEMAAIKNAAWGRDVNEAQMGGLVKVGRDLGLSVAMGDLIMLGGNIYITITGHLKLAHRSPLFGGFDEGPLPKEQWENWGIRKDAGYAWVCTVLKGGIRYTEVGWGGGSREQEANKGSGQPVAKAFPPEMARKRARARALALAFPVGLKSYEDVALGGIEIPVEILDKAQQTLEPPAGKTKVRPQSQAAPAQEQAPPAPEAQSEPPRKPMTEEEIKELERRELEEMQREQGELKM